MVRKISLTQGKFALVDDDSYGWLSQWKWYALKSCHTWYAVRKQAWFKGHQRLIAMHRHLRLCTRSENQCNRGIYKKAHSSTYKGVCRRKETLKWKAYITINSRQISLGSFDNEVKAALAYDDAAREHFGEFANTNFVDV